MHDAGKSRQQRFIELMSGRRRGIGPSLLRGAAEVGARFYGLAVGLRNSAYDSGLLRTHRLARPVVSIGNLTAGGTGKTVLVAEVARWIREAGHTPAVLLRGYKASGSPVGSDEAALLRRLLPGVCVEANPDRVAAGRRLLASPDPPDAFVLDDGFQHRRLHRDLDIVTVDATMDTAGPLARLLPRGLLREPVAALARADFVVLTRADQAPPQMLDRLEQQVASAAPNAPRLRCRHAVAGLSAGGESADLRPVDELADRSYIAFCGIGNPAAFAMTVKALPGECADFVAFDDHHVYSRADLAALADRARAADADLLLTTAKDRVKLADADVGLPILAVEVGIDWLGDPPPSQPLRSAVLDLL